MKKNLKIITEIINHLRFILLYPKIGPDMYLTHWLLFFKPFRIWFQNKKIYKIGKGSEVRPYSIINGTNSIQIGDNVIIQPGSILSANPSNLETGIIIEDDVLLAPNISIYSHTHSYKNINIPIKEQPYIAKKVVIKRGAWLGVNCVIFPGVTIGKNSVVAAGSIVKKDVPDYTVVAGAPAKIIRKINEY